MSFFVGKTVQLVFNTWTIAWSDSIYPSGKHRTPVKARFQYIMNNRIRISDPTASLLFGKGNVQIRKSHRVFITLLFLHFAIIQTSAVNSGGCSGFKPV